MSVDLNKEERTSKELEKKVAEQEKRLAETLVELDKAHSNNVNSQQQAEELQRQKAMVANQLKELESLKAQINQESHQLEQQRKEWQAHIQSNKLQQQININQNGLDNLKEFVNNSQRSQVQPTLYRYPDSPFENQQKSKAAASKMTPQLIETNVFNGYQNSFSPSIYLQNRQDMEGHNHQPYNQLQNDSNKPLKIDPNTPVFGKQKIDIDDWIFAFENACIIATVPFNKYVRLAINYTQGLALTMVKAAVSNETSWTCLKSELLGSFTPPDKRRTLRLKLRSLKQEGLGFLKFAEEFRHLSAVLQTCDEEKLDLFSQAVNKKTRDFFAVARPETFDAAFVLAARINGEELTSHSVNVVQKLKSVQCHCKKSGHIERDCWSKNGMVSEVSLNGKNKNSDKPNFIKKDYKPETKKPFKIASSDQKLKDSKCHRCGKKGHFG